MIKRILFVVCLLLLIVVFYPKKFPKMAILKGEKEMVGKYRLTPSSELLDYYPSLEADTFYLVLENNMTFWVDWNDELFFERGSEGTWRYRDHGDVEVIELFFKNKGEEQLTIGYDIIGYSIRLTKCQLNEVKFMRCSPPLPQE
ncbi:hypothetical protein DMA11_19110 [Marinilabiliaceae bacterium JC017]|nr:hypothetical protein DMA11_19110 [Marinilabiliaceae bacterium JC017]